MLDFELEFWCEDAEWDSDGGFDLVVVAVSGGVVAFAEEVGVLLVGERGGVEAMCGGELVALAEEDGVVVSGFVGHLDGMVWGELPADCVEGRDELCCGGRPEFGQECVGRNGWVKVYLGGDDGYERVSDECVDFLDSEEIAGGWVWCALDGDLEFVVATEGGHGWFAGGGVESGD